MSQVMSCLSIIHIDELEVYPYINAWILGRTLIQDIIILDQKQVFISKRIYD